MSDRYTYSKIVKTKDTNKNYLESTIYPKVKPSNDDIYIISTESDRLDLLAYTYYGDPNYWWIIAVANNLNDASFSIEPGKQLRIPGNINVVLNDFAKINK
jgi:outer membrane receptor protein involved in Fe transport